MRNSFPCGRIFESLDAGLLSALSDPGRHGGGKPARARVVRVDVSGHLQPIRPGLFNVPDRHFEFRRVRLADGFEVVDFGANAGLAGNRDHLVNAVQQPRAREPHVRRVETVILGCNLGQLDQLLGVGKRPGNLHQRRGNAKGTLFHGLTDQSPHAIELLGAGRPVLLAQLVNARGRSSHERGHIRRDAARL